MIVRPMLLYAFLLQPFQSMNQPMIMPSTCEVHLTNESAETIAEVCKAEKAVYSASQLEVTDPQRRQLFGLAVKHYNIALGGVSGNDAKMIILRGLVNIYEPHNLPDPYGREEVVHQLLSLDPGNIDLVYQLAEAQEGRGRYDAAEQTLIQARKMSPTFESFSRLTQFYAQAAARVHGITREKRPLLLHGTIDAQQLVTPPKRLNGRAPTDAPATGTPTAPVEIVIDETGSVSQARVARSVDQAVLEHVRYWRFEPTIVNGTPVKVRMIIAVDVPNK